MTIREMQEQNELRSLATGACCSVNSRGRSTPAKACAIRTLFQHDRDRILHSKSFRRLKYKTQVFLAPEGDHYRTRLTHTLEVSQVARTVARALRLNEDLTEAIALAHDLGHTPFGHAGERVLDQLVSGGFHHVRQSVRVVDILEKDGKGLNLTFEVRDGIGKHSKGQGGSLVAADPHCAATLEGQVVRLADVIAYVSHDLDDAIRGGVICADDLPGAIVAVVGKRHSERIDRMVTDLIHQSLAAGVERIALSAEMDEAIRALRSWLYEHVYRAPCVQAEFDKASSLLRQLFCYFVDNEEVFVLHGGHRFAGDSLEVSVADFIAGMTDRFALALYRRLFLPQPWRAL
ncbi:MAG: deoxyguanosinetriphosphate triphosphohydrolase [Pelovirga sp.]